MCKTDWSYSNKQVEQKQKNCEIGEETWYIRVSVLGETNSVTQNNFTWKHNLPIETENINDINTKFV